MLDRWSSQIALTAEVKLDGIFGAQSRGMRCMARDLTQAIEGAYSERVNLFVLALTGRTGSGCTATANALSKQISEIAVSKEGLTAIEYRKFDICHEFARAQWKPFKIVTVSTLIFSFLLEENSNEVEIFLKKTLKGSASPSAIQMIQDEMADLKRHQCYTAFASLVGPKHALINCGADAWNFYSDPLSKAVPKIRSALGNQYASVFQTLGDNIRKSGSAIKDEIKPDQVFRLITRVKRIAKAARRWDDKENVSSTRIVIDAVRNPLELVYLRDQFAAFYAIAVTADEDDRQSRLMQNGMAKRDIESLDKREYSKKSLEAISK